MVKIREYQYGFSEMLRRAMYDREARERKAQTMVAVLSDFLQSDFQSLSILDIGSSTGIIANYLSKYFGKVVGIDIDEPAIEFARVNFKKDNLEFAIGDAMNMDYPENKFDVVMCAHVYEHVPDTNRLIREIYRILKPGGVCYFAAGNRLNVNEPHYNLPLLSVVPRPLAHVYIKLSGKSKFYYEKHLSYWGLKKLVCNFELIDYTKKIIENPQFFHAEYMIRHGTIKAKLAKLIVHYAYWLCPSYIWLLRKKTRSAW